MPIDPSIPLQVQPLKLESGVNQLAMLESATKMQEMTRQREVRNMLSNVDPNSPDAMKQIWAYDPSMAMDFASKQATLKTAALTQQKTQGDIFANNVKQAKDALPGVTDQGSYDVWRENFKDKMPPGYTLPNQYSHQVKTGLLYDAKSYIDANVVNANTKATLAQGASQFQQTLNKPTFAPEYGGYVQPPTKDNPKGSFTPITNAEGTPLQSIKSLSPQETAVLSQAIVEGRLDPNAVNSRNQKTLAATLLANPTANLVNLHSDVVGTNAEARTTGTQGAKITMSATEASNMIGLVNDYSSKVDRTQYPSLNAVQNAVSKGTGGEDIVRFNNSINALINTYARAINPNGVATVDDKKHARELLNNAFSNGQVNAATQVMQQEINAALASPEQARQKLKQNKSGTGNKTNTPALPSGYVVD